MSEVQEGFGPWVSATIDIRRVSIWDVLLDLHQCSEASILASRVLDGGGLQINRDLVMVARQSTSETVDV